MRNLLVVDMQKGFINENNSFLIVKINNLLKIEKYDNVFYTKFYNHKNSFYINFLNCDLMINKEERQMAVDVLPNSTTFVKNGYGLKNSQIKKLKQLNITSMDICGTDIDACVLSIMFQLFDNSIVPVLLKDYVASSTSKTLEQSALNIITNQFGKKCIR